MNKEAVKLGLEQIPIDGLLRLKVFIEWSPERLLLTGEYRTKEKI